MPGPIEDYPGKPTADTKSTPAAQKSFKDIHSTTQSSASPSKKGGFSNFQTFLGKKNYQKWLQTFNMSVVQNIKKDKARQAKLERQMKAAIQGGNMWDA